MYAETLENLKESLQLSSLVFDQAKTVECYRALPQEVVIEGLTMREYTRVIDIVACQSPESLEEEVLRYHPYPETYPILAMVDEAQQHCEQVLGSVIDHPKIWLTALSFYSDNRDFLKLNHPKTLFEVPNLTDELLKDSLKREWSREALEKLSIHLAKNNREELIIRILSFNTGFHFREKEIIKLIENGSSAYHTQLLKTSMHHLGLGKSWMDIIYMTLKSSKEALDTFREQIEMTKLNQTAADIFEKNMKDETNIPHNQKLYESLGLDTRLPESWKLKVFIDSII